MQTIGERFTPPAPNFDTTPFLVFWETTRACDLACLHCRASAQPTRDADELTTEEGEQLLREAHAMGAPLVVLTGGDPAKRPDLVHLVRFGSRLGLRMALTPSATPLVTGPLLENLRSAGLARLALSLDGVGRATHDLFRGVDGSFARTKDLLRTAKDLGLTTQVNTTVTRFNLHELERIAESLVPLGIELWSVFFVVPTGRATAADVLDPEIVEGVLERLVALAPSLPFDIKTTAAPHYRRIQLVHKMPRASIAGLRDGIGRAPRGVNDGAGMVFVSHVGDVYPSGFLPVPVGNVRRTPLPTLYREHPFMQALRDPTRLTDKCGACPFKRICGGSRARAWAMTGNPFAPDPA
ncbi:MAG: TIGR04053 family radical SAM/SPASM domain-containing protein, partial [Deltaproteobacteria bacterium]|nr:TIGR04053 family radical SAM/SPASM domain-containing protein [Deltaproteobacteria bacterium]